MKRLRSVELACVVSALLLAPATLPAQEPMAQIQQMQTFLELMQGFFGIIESTHQIAQDPEKSAILQLNRIEDIYKERGERAQAIQVFRDVLERSSNPTIRNATYVMLSEALKETGRADEAVSVLRAGLAENLENAR